MSLNNLINNLIKELEENNINFQDIKIKNILEKYLPDDEFYNDVKTNENHYNKNIIFQNNYFEIIIITWNTTQKARIHNHSKNGCWLKLIKGKLKETIYDNQLNIKNINILEQGSISFMIDNIGLHSVENINNEISISLHIYSPINHITEYF
jgi:cysteine dioxygenase